MTLLFGSDTCSRKEEHGVQLYLTVVNNPGFGDQLNNKQCCQPIAAFLEEQFQRTPGYIPASISLLPVGMDSNILMYRS